MEVRGAAVIITGASEGIGLATARLFAEHGARLALASRSAAKLAAIAAELPDAVAIPTDMRDAAAIERLIAAAKERFGRLDLLINNAGQALYAPVEQINLDQYREIMELNVYGPLLAMQAVIPIMRAQGGGMILNVSSNVSKMYLPRLAAYASTKYALNAISLTARAELASENIRVSVMHPGLTATAFGQNAITSQGQAPSGGLPRRAGMPAPDPVEKVAARILDAVQTEVAEQFMAPQAQ